ncbi:lytic polysaccharide monooxygenase, partial [Dissoconium aciculare CBS 342.82]|uniref:Lytic polysaccharide monooxygenase n=1 Tax=Dissoconium aciculare CBS 342.82 TaxID=1314786 RepID=A0A6J3MF27_9PEZI
MVKALAVASFLGQAAAHIVMANPQPFSAEYMATSPLASDGSNFPCQYTGPSSYTFNHMNNMAVGEDQLLSFNGSASHGGGTCQLAVTLDTAPTKSSVWKNIMVLEGGCPVVGNGNDGTKTFKFQIPSGFPNGKATFSWVWNNRIGNREIYMSCAPITVSGGSDSGKDFYNSLPDLYVVNMPPEECTVAENGNLIIPNPG